MQMFIKEAVTFLSIRHKLNSSRTKSSILTQAEQLIAGDWYINIHTADHPAGELRGQVSPPKP